MAQTKTASELELVTSLAAADEHLVLSGGGAKRLKHRNLVAPKAASMETTALFNNSESITSDTLKSRILDWAAKGPGAIGTMRWLNPSFAAFNTPGATMPGGADMAFMLMSYINTGNNKYFSMLGTGYAFGYAVLITYQVGSWKVYKIAFEEQTETT